MKTVLRIFRRDLKRILKNPVALVVTLGVCAIPSLYAWCNILANWDPYQNTQDVSIAVVSLDRGDDVASMGHINAGEMVVEKLAENDQLNWVITTEQEAKDGVTSGEYYAAIVIPADFTSDLTSVLTGTLEQPELTYYVNEKLNPIAPKVTDTGATTVETQINETFVKTVAGVVVDTAKEAAGEAIDSTDEATTNIVAEIRTVQGTLDGISATIDDTNQTIDSARGNISSARSAITRLEREEAKANRTLAQATGVLESTRKDALDFASAAGAAITNGTSNITGVATDANAAAGAAAGTIAEAQGAIDAAASSADQIADQNAQLIEDLKALEETLPEDQRAEIEALIAQLEGRVDDAQQMAGGLEDASDALGEAGDRLSDNSAAINDAISAGAADLGDVQGSINSQTLPSLYGALDSFANASSDLQAALAAISPTLSQTGAILDQLDTTLRQAQSATGLTKESVAEVHDRLDGIATDIDAIQESDALAKVSKLLDLDSDGVAQFMSEPVTIEEQAVFPVANYGSGVTPFYTDLALWVGGFCLIAIYKLEVDDEEVGNFKPWEGYFGRWMLLMVLGFLQAVICCVGDLVIGIQCLDPVAFVFTGIIESFVYVNIIYAMSVAFKHVGKALCVLMVILQLPGAGGTYPIEMMPGFYQAVHPWLPFTYGINAMRETIAGYYANYYWHNIGMLLLFVIPALIIGVGMRRHFLNINSLFDKKLAETDLMICEHSGIEVEHWKLSSVIRALMDNEDYRTELMARAARFEVLYPRLIATGFVLLLLLPIGLSVVLFVNPNKLPWFIVWIVCIVLLCTCLLVTEYLHESLRRKTSMLGLSQDQMYALLGEQLQKEYYNTPLERLRRRVDQQAASKASPTEAPVVVPAPTPDDIDPITLAKAPITAIVTRVTGEHEDAEVPVIRRGTTVPQALPAPAAPVVAATPQPEPATKSPLLDNDSLDDLFVADFAALAPKSKKKAKKDKARGKDGEKGSKSKGKSGKQREKGKKGGKSKSRDSKKKGGQR